MYPVFIINRLWQRTYSHMIDTFSTNYTKQLSTPTKDLVWVVSHDDEDNRSNPAWRAFNNQTYDTVETYYTVDTCNNII